MPCTHIVQPCSPYEETSKRKSNFLIYINVALFTKKNTKNELDFEKKVALAGIFSNTKFKQRLVASG